MGLNPLETDKSGGEKIQNISEIESKNSVLNNSSIHWVKLVQLSHQSIKVLARATGKAKI